MRLVGVIRSALSGNSGSSAALQSLLTKFFVILLNATTSVVVARTLGPAGRGEMSAFQIWAGFLASLLTLGLPSSLIYQLRKNPKDAPDIIFASISLSLCLAGLIVVLGQIFLPIWLMNYSSKDVYYAKCFLLSAPIPVLLLTGRAAMEANGKFSHSNFAFWTGPLLTLATLLILARTHTLTALTGGLTYTLATMPVMLWLMRQVWLTFHPRARQILKTSSKLLHYGVRSWGIDLLTALSLQADQILVVHYLSPETMGIYVVTANVARLLSVFQTSAVMVLFPRLASSDASYVLTLTGRVLRITSLCGVVGALGIGLIGPKMIAALYGAEYAEAGSGVFRILLIEVVLSGATQILAQAFMALGRPGSITVIQGLGVAFALATMPALIRVFGVSGAAAALVASAVIRFTLTLFCFKPILRERAPRLLIAGEDLLFIADRFFRPLLALVQ